jgi:hypothetical protein
VVKEACWREGVKILVVVVGVFQKIDFKNCTGGVCGRGTTETLSPDDWIHFV